MKKPATTTSSSTNTTDSDSTSTPTPPHTLPSLAKLLGPPEPGLLDALLEGASEADLVALGQRIATSRLLTDDRRLYSLAYDVYTGATPAQKDHLRGFSLELLGLAVHHAIELEALLATHEGRATDNDISTASRDASSQEAFKAGLTLRDQARAVLEGAAGQNKPLLAEIAAAVGTAETPEKLAVGLSLFATLGARFLTHKKDALATRARLFHLDQTYVDSLTAAAKALRTATLAASGRSSGKKATQGPASEGVDAFGALRAKDAKPLGNGRAAQLDVGGRHPRFVSTVPRCRSALQGQKDRSAGREPCQPRSGSSLAPPWQDGATAATGRRVPVSLAPPWQGGAERPRGVRADELPPSPCVK